MKVAASVEKDKRPTIVRVDEVRKPIIKNPVAAEIFSRHPGSVTPVRINFERLLLRQSFFWKIALRIMLSTSYYKIKKKW